MIERIIELAEDILPTGDYIEFKQYIDEGNYNHARCVTEYFRLEHKKMTRSGIIELDSLVTELCV